jgi:hypothetical protein
MKSRASKVVSLTFPPQVVDGWPPFASECLPFVTLKSGYRLRTSPLFIKGLSRDDVISAEFDDDGHVSEWRHIRRSGHTTMWLMRLSLKNEIGRLLDLLKNAGCSLVDLGQYGCYAIDIPPKVPIYKIDQIVDLVNTDEVAVAFPSMRHEE